MNFVRHLELEGKHAFLSPSQYHWVNYNDQKLHDVFYSFMARQRGSELHDFACQAIKLGIKLPRSKKTLNMYINDAIGYRMTPEQPLYYSDNCFGTADAISFNKNLLRIHDLKTGVTSASMMQLEVYMAIFCLEYAVKPNDIEAELRLYQSDEVLVHIPETDEIDSLMHKIVEFDKQIDRMRDQL